jgi:cell division protein FtsB
VRGEGHDVLGYSLMDATTRGRLAGRLADLSSQIEQLRAENDSLRGINTRMGESTEKAYADLLTRLTSLRAENESLRADRESFARARAKDLDLWRLDSVKHERLVEAVLEYLDETFDDDIISSAVRLRAALSPE